MRAAVVDASVAAKWVLEEEFSDQAALLLGYDTLHAPSHWRIEAVNAVWGYVFRGKLAAADARERAVALMDMTLVEVAAAGLMRAAFDISASHGVTLYDSLYVALAIELGLPLVTADQRLIRRLQARTDVDLTWVGNLRG